MSGHKLPEPLNDATSVIPTPSTFFLSLLSDSSQSRQRATRYTKHAAAITRAVQQKHALSYEEHVGATAVSERQHQGQLNPDAFFTPFSFIVCQVQVVVRLDDVPACPSRSHQPRAALCTVHVSVAVVPVLDSVTEGP